MFGTDYPMWGADFDLAYFAELDLTDDERDRIFWRTCAELYGISC